MRYVIPIMLWSALAQAAPARRFAVVVGSNRGDEGDQPLKFAEDDARRVSRVLRELGGFRDVLELRTPTAGELDRALDDVARAIAAEKMPALVVFYYSGHADGDSLHVGGARLTLERLRGWLRDSRAAVRLAVLDSCHSGALTRVKGMHAQPPIEVRLTDEITTRGEALLTSSTSDEQARESDALRGSFFTHHLVSGLRGAADRSKDGRITLAEAYDYAYGKTVAQARGGQHPTFKYNLAGRGDVILTSLNDGGAWLAFGDDAGGLYYIFSDDGTLLGDVDVGGPLKVAVAPGRYEVRKGSRALRVIVSAGEERRIHDEELGPAPSAWAGARKGADLIEPDYGEPLPPPPPIAAPPPDVISNAELARIERARMGKLYGTGRGLLIAGLAGLVPFAVTLAAGYPTMNDYRGIEAIGAMVPALVEMALASSALAVTGGVLMQRAADEERRWSRVEPGFTARATVAEHDRARAERKRGTARALIGTGVAAMALALPLQIAGASLTGLGDYHWNPQNAEMNALHSSGVATLTLGIALAAIGGAIGREARAELEPYERPARLTPLVFRDGAGVGLSGRF